MSVELGRRLLASELITRENVQDALFLAEERGISFPRALVERGIVTEAELDEEIARLAGPGLRYVQGAADLITKLPREMPRRLCALPTRIDPKTGIIDIAAADPFDPYLEAEMSFHLEAPVRVLRASLGAVEQAIRRIEIGAAAEPPAEQKLRPRRMTPALPYGAPDSVPLPAPSTPIPLVKRPPVYTAFPNDLNVEDTYADEPDDSLSRTAGWGTVSGERATIPAPSSFSTNDFAEEEEEHGLSRTAAWGTPVYQGETIPAPNGFSSNDSEEDETDGLSRTAAWGTRVHQGATIPAPNDFGSNDLEEDESTRLSRTAAWGAPPARVPAAAPVQQLSRTLGFEEEPPRVSFPSTPPPGHDSIPPPLGFAPPELSAWKGLATVHSLTPKEFTPPPNVPETTSWSEFNTGADVETTFVSAQDDPPAMPSRPVLVVETVVAPPIVETNPPAQQAETTSFEEDFDDEPKRPTLVEFPPPQSMVDVKATIAAIAAVSSRDAIVELAFRSMAMFARRVALFTAKRNGFHGWMCNDAFGDSEALRKIVIPNDQPSIMATAAAASIYLGPIPTTPVHQALLAVMGSASRDVAVACVRVGGKVAAVLVADELRDTLAGTRRMDELARAMGEALTRLLKTRG